LLLIHLRILLADALKRGSLSYPSQRTAPPLELHAWKPYKLLISIMKISTYASDKIKGKDPFEEGAEWA